MSSRFNRRAFLGGTTLAVGLVPGLSRAEFPAKVTQNIEKPGRTPNTPCAVNVEMWFGKKTFLEKIQAADELGYPAIEFWPYQGKPVAEAAKLLKEKKMAVSQFTAWGFGKELNNPAADHAKFLKAIEESCDVADTLDCQLFTVVIGDDIDGLTKEQMHAAAIPRLKMAAAICEKRKKTIIVEAMNPRNHPKHCLYGGKDAIAICKAVGSPNVKINWDLYHMQIVDGDLCMKMRDGWDYIGYLQLADNPGRHEPGTGEVNYTRVFQEVKALKYAGFMGLECNPLEDDRTAAERVYIADTF